MRERFTQDMKDAMKAGDKRKLGTVRLVQAALKDKDIEARGASQPAPGWFTCDMLMISLSRPGTKRGGQFGRPRSCADLRVRAAAVNDTAFANQGDRPCASASRRT